MRGIRGKEWSAAFQIAQMIGASRETVTRLFADFKKKQLLQVKGSTVIIKNRAGLESVVSS